ncbi:Uncharacterised protein [Mycobacteroides abscessus subsp. abscessus]|nr:Uncharacterised protein [Mycobacteroides abscessus subsp. abscessus]
MVALPAPSAKRSSVAAASWALVLRYRLCMATIARARLGCADTISAISWVSASMPSSWSITTSCNSAMSRVSSWEEKKVASTPNTSLILSSTGTVSGRTSCSIWFR